MRKPILLKLCLFLLTAFQIASAQDPHLSQYEASPVFINAANTGNFDGKVRLFAGYKRQWGSLSTPFTTTHAITDFSMGKLGLSLEFLNDDPGGGGLKHTNGLLGLGYHLDKDNHRLSLGVQFGFIQKSFDPNSFTFDSQYQPETGYDPSTPSGEIFPITQAIMGDLNSGLAYTYKVDEPQTIMGAHIGVGFAHINQPVYTFLNNESYLPMRTSIYGSIDLLASSRLIFKPTGLWMRQGTAEEITVGALIEYEIDQEVFGHIGAKYRLGDAIIPQAGLMFNNMYIGLSYAVTVSELSRALGIRGGPELVLSYTWNGQANPKTNYKARKAKILNDQDGDGVKDARDDCPDIPGVRKFNGCPDSDGDGIVDSEDVCPTQPGPVERNGCPAMDRDGDGVLDKADECPDDPGLIAFKGCPDSDNDGLPDHVDKCPQEPGPRVRSGCPTSDIDADGDGIPDKVDLCPTVAGITDFQGCPDTDKDGISDFEDKCPLIAGSKQNQGCPEGELDVDGDGILNAQDRCPYVPGLANFQGCPDTDKDGLSDLDDGCPLIFGPVSNKGCPLPNTQPPANAIQQPQIPVASSYPTFGPVLFDTDQAIIKPEYFRMLNELADYMIAHPETKLMLAGHTDDRASSMYNMALSQNRAKAVEYYLTMRGIPSSRITKLSYGEIMPRTINSDENGRALNRRVEMMLSR